MSKKYSSIIKKLKPYKPDKVILFGSHARGNPGPDADIDLLIIKKTRALPYKRIPQARSHLNDLDLAFDILVLTPKEVSEQLRLGDFFMQDIISNGKVLYEAKQ